MVWNTFLLVMTAMVFSSSSYGLETYVVHMDKSKMEAFDVTSNTWYDFVLESITPSQHSPPQLLYVYQNALSGFSAHLSHHNLQLLTTLDGFLYATKDELLPLHTTHSPRFLGLEQGLGLWTTQNLASDVIIGVIDTGIWPEHPSFTGSGLSKPPSRWKGKCQAGTKFCNRKIIGARAFFKGYEAIAGRINETVDYRSPRDSSGHGTHTASTAGGRLVKGASFLGRAKGSAAGIRYTARIAAYKACFRLGCTSSDILAAIDQAISDGVDVLSLSLGGASKPYYSDSLAVAAFRAIQKGIFVSFSAGNSGPFKSTVTNAAPWVMTVAASYTDRGFPTEVRLGNGLVFSGTSLYTGKATKRLPLVYNTTTARFCYSNSLWEGSVKGKIVICDRGINGRVEKGEEVKRAGGLGMILTNNENNGEEQIADPHILPATSLGAKASNILKMYTNSTNPTAKIKFKGTSYGNVAPTMAAFSSRGPSSVGPDIIKPDITAPGVNILAAWPPNVSPTEQTSDNRSVSFNIVSGTSMSCPHISGVAALLKSLHTNWSAAAIKSAMMTSAQIHNSRNGPITDASNSGAIANPFVLGSGHVDPERASDPGLIYDISSDDYLVYLCSLKYNSSQMSLFSGGGNFSCPQDSGLQPGDLNYPSFSVALNKKGNSPQVASYMRRVTNVGSAVGAYKVKVSEPEGVSVTVDPKVLVFNKLGQKLGYQVRFVSLGNFTGEFSFGSLVWVSEGKYSVRSPIAVTWS